MTATLPTLSIGGTPVDVYVAEPVQSRGVALLLLGEIYNLNAWIRQVAERYAGLGFHVLAPDLFWRLEPGQDLPYTPAGQQAGRALSQRLDRVQATEDLAQAVTAWRARLPAGMPVLAVGFCLGGELAFLAAAAGAVDGAVGYYPTRMETHLAQGARVRVPTQLHLGALDPRTPPELVNQIRDAVAGSPVEVVVHADADHGFGRFGHPPYHARAAAAAQHACLQLATRLSPGAADTVGLPPVSFPSQE